jgi:hypothetical protein
MKNVFKVPEQTDQRYFEEVKSDLNLIERQVLQ